MAASNLSRPSRRWFQKVVDPRHRHLHVTIITVALVVHLATHYATFFPFLRGTFGSLPYFRLHVLHEAEFLLIIAYAGIVLGLRGGLVALGITAVSSVPFILQPYIFGSVPAPNEIRDLAMQVGLILLVGLLITLLYDRDNRRREAEGLMETLREVDQLRRNFISMASHEMRSPLTAVMGFSELLLSRELPSDKQREWAQAIHAEAKRMADLIEDLLSVSRIESGAIDVRLAPLRLHEVVQRAVSAAAGPSPNHQVELRVPATLPEVAADGERLLQVLVNLLSNAMKYSPKGSRVVVSASLLPVEGRVRVDVTDEGLGISEEDQARLFTSFYRARQPGTEDIPGTGLGLYIVKSLVELMGGTVSVRSALGAGSTFSFTLPLWVEPEPANEPLSARPQMA